jgi:DNA-binding SARP family transcriptional activator
VGFTILGRLSVEHDGRDLTPTAPKVRQVLAFLLVSRNAIVPFDELVDELWGDEPPDSAMTTLQTYVYKLRKYVFDLSGQPGSGPAVLHTRSRGYLLEVPDETVDVHRFEQLSRDGRAAQQAGDQLRAGELLTEALALWQGRALTGVGTGEILGAHVTRLEETRLQVLGMRVEADLALGRHEELISQLKVLVRRHPMHERFHANLMTALDRAGRRYEALQVYRNLRDLLVAELGLEPSPAVRRLHQSLLRAEPADEPGPAGAPAVIRALPTVAVPAQLPPDLPEFVGRDEVLDRICATLRADPDRGGTAVPAVLIGGMVGAGKTALAVRAGHRVSGHHPDGQLYADLRGSGADPVPPLQVLHGFLRALGAQPRQLPERLEDASGLFRTWTNGRRLLVLLDDAGSAAQLAPLLPASSGSSVIITSRWGLHGLPGAGAVRLDGLGAAEAVELLARIAGPGRIAAEPDAAERIAWACGRLPLALRCAGARLAAAPTWSLRKLAGLLEGGPAFDQLRFGELDLRAEFDRGYERLDPADGSALRLISLLPPAAFTGARVAGLLGTGVEDVEARLARLVAHHLLDARAGAGPDGPRYELHRLVRLHARERLEREFLEPAARPAAPRPRPGELTVARARRVSGYPHDVPDRARI